MQPVLRGLEQDLDAESPEPGVLEAESGRALSSTDHASVGGREDAGRVCGSVFLTLLWSWCSQAWRGEGEEELTTLFSKRAWRTPGT